MATIPYVVSDNDLEESETERISHTVRENMANNKNYQKNLKELGDLCEKFYAPKIPEDVLKEGREFMAEIKR